jgi:ribonuclease E
MTRQRIRPGLERNVYTDCPACRGSGVVKTPESMAIEVVRHLMLACHKPEVAKVSVTVTDEVADYLSNKKRRELARLEDEGQMSVEVLGIEGVSPEHLVIQCWDADGREVKFSPY